MQVLDRTGVGTLWSICKTKFALAGHTHNYAGSGSAGGSANSAISVVDYGQTSKTIQIGYAGSGITGEQIKYIAGYTSGSGDVNAKIKDVSKEALRSWLGLGTLAYSSATITDNKVTQNAVKSSDYTNWRSLVFSAANSATEGFTPSTTTDGVFIANTLSVQPSSGTIKATKFKGALEGNASTASNASTVNGHTVNANVPSNAKFTDTNTWRPIQDNLTSTSTSESLSANQGRVLKGLVDGKANSSHTHSWSQISGAPATATRWPSWGEVTGKPGSFTPSSHTHDWSQITGKPDIKSWSETKSYIDNKVDSENNYPSYSLQSYIQSQLKPFGLTCRTYPCNGNQYDAGAKCGILIDDNSSGIVSSLFRNNSLIRPGTFYSGIDTKICKQITELYGKNIYCIWNNYMIDVEYTGSPSSGFSLNVCFFNTLTGTTKKIKVFTNNVNTGMVRDSAVACTYDNLYVANDRSLYVFDKSLNFKRYADVVTNQEGGIRYLFNYGDLGIFISTWYNGSYYCYKNGAISKYTGSVSSLKYTKNGHKYDLETNNYQLITDDLAIKSIVNDSYIAGNTLEKLLFFIVDLQKNIEFQIRIPVELFGIRMTGNSQYLFTGVPVVEMEKYNNSDGDALRYYVLVYKE